MGEIKFDNVNELFNKLDEFKENELFHKREMIVPIQIIEIYDHTRNTIDIDREELDLKEFENELREEEVYINNFTNFAELEKIRNRYYTKVKGYLAERDYKLQMKEQGFKDIMSLFISYLWFDEKSQTYKRKKEMRINELKQLFKGTEQEKIFWDLLRFNREKKPLMDFVYTNKNKVIFAELKFRKNYRFENCQQAEIINYLIEKYKIPNHIHLVNIDARIQYKNERYELLGLQHTNKLLKMKLMEEIREGTLIVPPGFDIENQFDFIDEGAF